MSYRLIDLELNQPISEIRLEEYETGLGIIVRRNDVPLGYVMKAFDPNTLIAVDVIENMISQELGEVILTNAIASNIGDAVDEPQIPSLTIAICTKDHPVLFSLRTERESQARWSRQSIASFDCVDLTCQSLLQLYTCRT